MLQLTMSSAMLNGFTPPMRLLVRRIGLLFRRLVFDFANNSQQNETPSHGTKILGATLFVLRVYQVSPFTVLPETSHDNARFRYPL